MTLKNKFRNYEDGLKYLNIDDLNERRKKHSLEFAKNCVKNEKVRNFFLVNSKNDTNTTGCPKKISSLGKEQNP